VRGYDPPHFDPHLALNFKQSNTLSFVYSKLARYKVGPGVPPGVYTIEPDLAERWEEPDELTWVFHLRKGVRWQNAPPVNGRELTAEDVKFTFDRFLGEKANPHRYTFDPVDRVEVVDRHTVRFRLKEPFVWLLHMLASPWASWILAREVLDKYGDFKRPEAAIGTGPFLLARYEPNVKTVFKRNPDYFRAGLPHVDGVDWLVMEDDAAGLAAYRTGQLDAGPWHFWTVRQADVAALKKTHPQLVYQDFLSNVTGVIYMRTDKPPFNDVRVRRAISLAIDRKAWNDALLHGEGCIDSGPVPCAMKDWKLDASKIEPARAKYLVGHDPAEARRLLAEAGHARGLATPIFHWPGYAPPWRSYYELAVDNLAKIGIAGELKPEEYGKYISTTYLGKYEKMAMGPVTPFTEVDDFLYGGFAPEQPNNRSHVADAELSRLLTAQRRELDPKKRKELVDEIQRYLADKAYYAYIPNAPQYISHPPSLKGFKHHDGYGLGYRLMHAWLDRQ
jgi:peptide/nickel transport system substrate-binding protein